MRNVFSVVVRGGGDLATGVIYQLHQMGFSVLVLETEKPSAIRRQVAFSQAVYEKEWTVEGVTAVLADSLQQAKEIKEAGKIPVLIDPMCQCLQEFQPHIVIDAIIAKKNLGTNREMADCVIALGPGFCAGKDAHFVIETQRGHDLGRVISQGYALPNTGIPGTIAGYDKERVIHAPAAGVWYGIAQIGDLVEAGQVIAKIDDTPVTATIAGVLRGILPNGYQVPKGFKVADIDPRLEEKKNCSTISDKARCIAAGVMQAIGQSKQGNFIWN